MADRKPKGKPKRRRKVQVQQPTNLDPWERQPGETDKAYAAFLVYRDQPANGVLRRSLEKCGRTCGVHPSQAERWSASNAWRDRVAAWDRHQQAVKQAAMDQRLQELGVLQANQVAAAANALTQPIMAYLGELQRLRVAGQDPHHGRSLEDLELAAIRASRALPRIVGVERLVAGLSTANVDVHADVSIVEARRQAESMSRADQERLLAGEGVVDGREAVRAEVRPRTPAARQA